MRSIFLFIILFSSTLQALDFKLDMGAGIYYTGAQGTVEYVTTSFEGSTAEADLISEEQYYVWADIDTRTPYVPKIRFEYLSFAANGDSQAHLQSGDADIQQAIDDYINNGGIPLNDQYWYSHLQQDIYDVTLYYEYFEDSDFPSLGFGIGYRYFTYIYIMDIHYVPGLQFGDRDNSGAPNIYLTSRYDMPSINMGFEGDAKAYLFGDSTMYDYKFKLDLMFDIDESTRAGVEFGYRAQYFSLEGGDVENVRGDMKYQGIFIGALMTFH